MRASLALSHVALPDASRGSDVVAILNGTAVTHTQFVHQVQDWCATFAAHAGGTVALYFEDAGIFAPALFGAWHAGMKVVLLSDRQPTTLERVRPEVDICAGTLPEAVMPPIGNVTPGHVALTPLCLEQTELAIFTSGSTGKPVRIGKRLQQLDAEVQALETAFGRELDQPVPAQVYSSVSHQHIYGLLFQVLWPLAARRPIMVERLAYPEEVVARLSKASSAVLVSSPALLTRLPDHLDWAGTQGRVRAIFSSGGELTAATSAYCQSLMGRIPTEVFGSSETGGIAWRRADDGQAWSAFACVEWRCREGLLDVRSPYLDTSGEWHTTADRITPLEEAGSSPRFLLLGRSDRIVKIAEKRVSLTALEAALRTCPEVAAARALSLPSGPQNAAGRIAAVVQLTELGWSRLVAQGRRAMNEYLRAALHPHVEAVALPRRWRYVEALPMNDQGKVTQSALQRLFRPWLPPATWTQRSEFEAHATLVISEDLLAFDGHFPQASLVPGVAQLHWVHRFSRDCFTLPTNFLRLELLKFQQPMLPGQSAQLMLTWNPAKGALGFRFQSEVGTHSSGRLVYETES